MATRTLFIKRDRGEQDPAARRIGDRVYIGPIACPKAQ